MKDYDIIVVGAGHAGIEAVMAIARMGLRAILVTQDASKIGLMSCNPAIGGVGKGQLVKEIDALGGEMGKAADACGIQFRTLNASKGPAVQSSRAQIDMDLYNRYMVGLVKGQENVYIKEAKANSLLVENNTVIGIVTEKKEKILASCVVLAPGTFLDGLIHMGLKHFSGGRINEAAALGLGDNLKELGFKLLRFKTGTCPRLDKNTIDYSALVIQDGDCPARPFSFSTEKIIKAQLPCYITYTNKETHRIIQENLNKSPLYTGIIKATGVRYCPSIEDKIVRFCDKERHQIFLEPQGQDTIEVYPNGLSTSLPEDIQNKFVHSIKGLKKAKIIRFGYGIEHTVVESTQLYPTLETKLVRNLYLAGQINGTTGYEEAAAQGLIAGINAALRAKNKEPFILDRSTSYIGVLIDDLTTKGTNEPYRMFTSRVEYRLIIRQDNADIRLRRLGYHLGLVSREDYQNTEAKIKAIKEGMNLLKATYIKPSVELNSFLRKLNTTPINKKITLESLLKRPQVSFKDLMRLDHLGSVIPYSAFPEIEIEIKYSGFIQRQVKDVEKFKNLEKIRIPRDINYAAINSLSREIREKLSFFQPLNLGQASRISGVTPAAISLLMVYLRKING